MTETIWSGLMKLNRLNGEQCKILFQQILVMYSEICGFHS